MNEIQRGNVGEIPRRILQVNSPGNPVPFLSPILLSALTLESDRPEWKFLSGQRAAAMAFGAIAPVALQYSFASVTNPSTSTVLVVVQRLRLDTLAGANVGVKITPSALPGGLITAGVRDGRWQNGGLLTRPVATCVTGTSPVLPPEPFLDLLPPSTQSYDLIDYVVPPGLSFLLIAATVNVGINAGAIGWYERPITADELR